MIRKSAYIGFLDGVTVSFFGRHEDASEQLKKDSLTETAMNDASFRLFQIEEWEKSIVSFFGLVLNKLKFKWTDYFGFFPLSILKKRTIDADLNSKFESACKEFVVSVVNKAEVLRLKRHEHTEDFYYAKILVFNEVITVMQSYAMIFEIPLENLGLEGLDPDRDFT